MRRLRFDTTRWSVVLAAGAPDSAVSRQALATLCEIYWYPLYVFVRRRGHGPDDARDLTQAFLLSLLERRDFDHLRQERGTFRGFLLAALQHFLANETARRRTIKRGGSVEFVSIDADAEGRYRLEPADAMTPEKVFDRRWALTVIDRVLADLREDWTREGRAGEFARLKDCLLGSAPAGGYRGVAESLGSTEGAVRVAAHRLRKSFQRRLRDTIGRTVLDPRDVDEEIRYLIRAIGQ
jgi:RNA polymerase sigma-70 factor (ECF subfamily)